VFVFLSVLWDTEFLLTCLSRRHSVLLPDPDGPTITTPILCCNCSYTSRHFRIWKYQITEVKLL